MLENLQSNIVPITDGVCITTSKFCKTINYFPNFSSGHKNNNIFLVIDKAPNFLAYIFKAIKSLKYKTKYNIFNRTNVAFFNIENINVK